MSTAFTRTLRSLDADRFLRRGAAAGAVGVLLAGWGAWACCWRVALREVSGTARIEVDGATVPVQAALSGRVVRTYLTVGKAVTAGDPLVELDSNPERLQYLEENTRAETIGPALAALHEQERASLQAAAREQQAAGTAVQEARANRKSAEAGAKYAAAEVARMEALRKEGLTAERDFQKARADADQIRATVERESLVAERLAAEQRTRESDRDAAIRALHADIARLGAQQASAQAAMRRLENEMDRRIIRAPLSGRLGEAEVLRPGAVVNAGEKIAVIVPEGNLLIVAQFPPAAALGRLFEGQSGEARLEGFPWAEWGTVPLLVSRVAGEIRDGTVRVELRVDASRHCRIPLRHGMPGSVEVTVERVAPAMLLLRLAGRFTAAPRSAFPPASAASPEGRP